MTMHHEKVDELKSLYLDKNSLKYSFDLLQDLQIVEPGTNGDMTSFVAQHMRLIEAWIQHQPVNLDLGAQRSQKEATGIATTTPS